MSAFRTLLRASKARIKDAVRPVFSASEGSAPRLSPATWGLGGLETGKLALEGLPLHDLGAKLGFPLHVVHAARLRDNARRLLAAPAGHARGCEVFYSYKTNPVPGVLAELHRLGMGAEVISHYELWLARRLGVPPQQIVYNGPAKSVESIREAVRDDILLLNCNHREEIPVVARIAEELGRRPRVGIRVTVGDGWAAQFGVPVASGQALAAYEEALRLRSLDVVGLHAHRGGMIRSREELVAFVDAVLAFTDELHLRLGIALQIIDFGGSLATPTVAPLHATDLRLNRALHREIPAPNPAASLTIEDYVATLMTRVEEHHRRCGRPTPRVFIEPGRAVTGNAQLLVASVLGTKEAEDTCFAILDAGINLAESCRSEYHQLFSANRYGEAATKTFTLVGPICVPGDTLYWAARMPSLRAGDSVLIMDSGAYFVPFATSFSFPQPAIVMIDEGTARPLRRGERFEDLVALDDLAGAKQR